MIAKPSTVIIEDLQPLVNAGRYPLKAIVGDYVTVEADIFKDGHDVVSARLKWRKAGERPWQEAAMEPLENDRWRGSFTPEENTFYEYTIEAWGDLFLSWRYEFSKKFDAAIADLENERLGGIALIAKAARRAKAGPDRTRLRAIVRELEKANASQAYAIALRPELAELLDRWADRSLATEHKPYATLFADRPAARFAAWYEFFPRSAGGHPDRGSTFRECLPRIDDAKAMGFDVIYFPPIHPIGATARKGRNNSVTSQPGEPGVPYAIGNRFQNTPNGGGHRDVAPELGTLEDFDWLVKQIHERGMEIALDFAINCSPDHPYVAEHPEWFFHRPDGTIKYAENPPKKYEDVYPLDYHNANWRALWEELTDVVLFWAERKVRLFRVDNPHTKPVAFWEHLISTVRARYPDVIFLSEAFTRPKMMKVLAKAGFSQSYTYFTWRTTKAELIEYFTEITQPPVAGYFRGHLWPNTPDILPWHLQHGNRATFLIRATLAATLSPLYGIYSGFELCENAAVPGKEEYLDSEKYQFKGRDWNAPGNIKAFFTRLNLIRKENRALQLDRNLRFHAADHDDILFYSKADGENVILIIVNLDPWNQHHSLVHLPLERFGLGPQESYEVHDLLWDERYLWHGATNYVELDPQTKPVHLLRLQRQHSSESDFEQF